MADSGHIKTLLNGLADRDQQRVFVAIFEYLLKNLRIGRALSEEPAENLGGGFFSTTTPSVANEEFTVAHSFGRTPYLLIPVLPLDTTNAKIVRLQVARPADAHRVYLMSPETDAAVYFYLEG